MLPTFYAGELIRWFWQTLKRRQFKAMTGKGTTQ
jgi:hypothetical protein